MQIPSPPVSPMASENQKMHRTGISNRRQSHIADSLSDDHGIHKAVKLLKKISNQYWQEKTEKSASCCCPASYYLLFFA